MTQKYISEAVEAEGNWIPANEIRSNTPRRRQQSNKTRLKWMTETMFWSDICRLDLLLLFVAAAAAAVVVSKANLRDGYRGIMFLAIWKKQSNCILGNIVSADWPEADLENVKLLRKDTTAVFLRREASRENGTWQVDHGRISLSSHEAFLVLSIIHDQRCHDKCTSNIHSFTKTLLLK